MIHDTHSVSILARLEVAFRNHRLQIETLEQHEQTIQTRVGYLSLAASPLHYVASEVAFNFLLDKLKRSSSFRMPLDQFEADGAVRLSHTLDPPSTCEAFTPCSRGAARTPCCKRRREVASVQRTVCHKQSGKKWQHVCVTEDKRRCGFECALNL